MDYPSFHRVHTVVLINQTKIKSNNFYCILNVKVRVKLILEQATKAERGSRGIALLFL